VDYSPITMFYAVGAVGKPVILLLLAASIYTWVLIVMGAYSIVKISRSTQSARASDVFVAIPAVRAAGAAPAGGGAGK